MKIQRNFGLLLNIHGKQTNFNEGIYKTVYFLFARYNYHSKLNTIKIQIVYETQFSDNVQRN